MFYAENECSLDEFVTLRTQGDATIGAAHAAEIASDIPIFDCQFLRGHLAHDRAKILSDLATVLQDGAGVFVLKGAFSQPEVLDGARDIFIDIIAEERTTQSGGDHFAKQGANDRIWNALEKLCLRAPRLFATYYSNDMIALASEAWLGPNYQITSQINVVRPGGKAQQMHRDYHLGFQTTSEAGRYPAHMHQLSQGLTLQGAVAHCDMPIDSGPTKLLPFSQLYPQGYMAWRRQDFIDYFEDNFVQLQLEKGDAVFFNPALFHAAGDNRTTNISRMANLLQISSAFGRAMESVNRAAMCKSVFPELQSFDPLVVETIIAATAEGYSFPTNLDRDPPTGGLAPTTQHQLMRNAFRENWDTQKFNIEIDALATRQHTTDR